MNKHPTLPKKGIDGLKENWRSDLQAGFFVFLIALPLSLGIAIGSGFPPSAGIITAVVGGLLVSRLNGSYIVINGPAGGLIVVMLAAVESLSDGDLMSGYRYTLAAVMITGLLQVVMGRYKLGSLSAFFPAPVVHGMLAAMGISIMARQVHVMLGATPEPGSLFSSIAQIPNSLLNSTPEIATIGIISFIVLLIWPLLKHSKIGKIPAPFIVLFLGMGLAQFFGLQHEHYHLGQAASHEHLISPPFLVDIPSDFSEYFYLPDFSKIDTFEFWIATITICMVASLESLLSASAAEKVDPYKRPTDLDRDLAAVGLGNAVSGFLGGLPMIAEFVRSSANVEGGAQTGWANFFHGLILLLFVVLFPHFIHNIPHASLAALLVFVGYRRATPQVFRDVLAIGKDQLFLFVVTILAVLETNLLLGVFFGVFVKLLLHLSRGVWLNNLFKIHFTIKEQGDFVTVKIIGSALFSNFLPFKKAVDNIAQGKTITFDFSNGYLIDHSILIYINEFCTNYVRNGGNYRHVGHALEKYSDHDLAVRLMTADDRKQ
ncbi:MAG: SulP family inorganic anion transporter [Methyloprofundus sp.]|uniref:SulP family inorganic anion transporter n=1 Tax=Methyloprofundus sp. TaxID=2020875 RepID=UPI001A1193F8|nr:SulP family inorganic anion transporter [Methyloprofundus sp.]HIL79067.1 SulP family inorganic anion transporter [Methylococcales bacterium]